MTVALALLAFTIIALFSGLIFGALRQAPPDEPADPVWSRRR